MHKWIEARNQGNETQKHPWMRKLIISNLVEKKQRRQLEGGLSWAKRNDDHDDDNDDGIWRLLSRCSTAKLSGDRGKRGKKGAIQRKVSRFHNSRVEEQDGVFRREKYTFTPIQDMVLLWCDRPDGRLQPCTVRVTGFKQWVSLFSPSPRVSLIIKTLINRMHLASTHSSGPFLLGQRTMISPENADIPILL
jgi:hypothetical protein